MKRANLPFENIGEFRLDTVIQESQYTLSVKGFQSGLNRPVFIKLLKPQTQQQKQWMDRFRREARISAKLKHPNIVDVYTLGEEQGYAYMAMAFVDGLSLRQVVEQQGHVPLDQCCLILQQILPALQLSHDEGIVHRDIKPGNLLVDRYGVVRITDFGLAHLGQDIAITQQGAILGTPAYMAPEQITGEPLSPATDIFSLGATIYELLTGKKAFGGDNYSACLQKILNDDPPPPSSLQPELPDELDALINAMLQKEPQDRPASAMDVQAQFQGVAHGDEKQARAALVSLVRSLKPEEESGEEERAIAPPEPTQKNKFRRFRRKTFLLPALLAAMAGFAVFLVNPFKGSDLSPRPRTTDEQQGMPESLAVTKEKKPEQTVLAEETLAGPVSTPPVVDTPTKRDAFQPDGESDTTSGASHEPPDTVAAGPALVRLSIEPWANILLDGKPVDSMVGAVELEVAAGEHEIVLSHPEFSPHVMNLQVAAGDRKQVHYSFLQEAGFLNIQVRPWAEVYLDGQYIDNTPLSRLLVCPAGERLLELRNPNFETFRQVLQVQKGDTLNIFHVMK